MRLQMRFNSTKFNSNQKCNKETYQCEYKKCHKCKKHYSWNPITSVCENIKYFNGITNNQVFTCDEIISVMNIISTKVTNTIYFAHSFISDHITINNYYYSLSVSKLSVQKKVLIN